MLKVKVSHCRYLPVTLAGFFYKFDTSQKNNYRSFILYQILFIHVVFYAQKPHLRYEGLHAYPAATLGARCPKHVDVLHWAVNDCKHSKRASKGQ